MPNNPFSNIKVTPNYHLGHLVQWWLDPAFKGQVPFNYELSVHQDPSSPPVKVIPVGDNFFGVDNSRLRQNFHDDCAYKVTLITADGQRHSSNPVSLENGELTRHQYLIASEMIRKEWVRFKYVGQLGWLLKRKMYEAPLKNEVDPVTGEAVVDTSTGFGVGHGSGYYPPAVFKFSLEQFNQATDYHPEGRGPTYVENSSFRTVCYPYLSQHDILVTREGRRYMVDSVEDIHFPGTFFTMIQNCTGRLLPNSDTVYSIEVPTFPSTDTV